MKALVESLVSDLERGRLSRRQFCEAVAAAAAVHAGGAEAAAPAPAGLKVIGINHIGYACPDYRVARDFYASVFGMEVLKDDGRTGANLGFGPAQGRGGSYLALRTAPVAPNPPDGAVVDHVCFTIPNWDETKVRQALAARGLEPFGRPGSLHVYDPFDYDVQFASAAEENAFR
jgi:catechol 2,3-dioxygenase-like lactoylglutathione lyase family enzyme